jgi:glycerol kinase
MDYLIAIDQGTSSSRAAIFDRRASLISISQEEFTQIYPKSGWVEHNPEDIWNSVVNVTKDVLSKGKINQNDIKAIGITNQRETTLIWDRETGNPIHNAIVWQDRRTTSICKALRDNGLEDIIIKKTGLRLDPYFSATKISWIIENVPGAMDLLKKRRLAFGTVDSFLLWRLTGGRIHATDATNASRTMLFNIHTQEWDDELLEIFGIPSSLLPEVHDSNAEFGDLDKDIFGFSVPICGVAGDQQAALIGQAGFKVGMTKITFGTGCFAITNTGDIAIESKNKLLTTVAYRLNNKVTYGLEGSVFVAGSAIQWLRDQLMLIKTADETESIAESTGMVENVQIVPAFTGLGAPHWDPEARGAILGLTRDTTKNQIVTATLQSVVFQTCDLAEAMLNDSIELSVIRVDGGMANNSWFLQFLADMLQVKIERPTNIESTIMGVAFLTGLSIGFYDSIDEIEKIWSHDLMFTSKMNKKERDRVYSRWIEAVSRVRSHD